jgi:hypothetical protein
VVLQSQPWTLFVCNLWTLFGCNLWSKFTTVFSNTISGYVCYAGHVRGSGIDVSEESRRAPTIDWIKLKALDSHLTTSLQPIDFAQPEAFLPQSSLAVTLAPFATSHWTITFSHFDHQVQASHIQIAIIKVNGVPSYYWCCLNLGEVWRNLECCI